MMMNFCTRKGELSMGHFNLLETNQLNYLYPLSKWGFLDLKDLFEESRYPGSLSAFRKYILRLEKKEVVHSFRTGRFGRKYVYLTRKGGIQVGLDIAGLNVSTETLLHDIIVRDITRALLDFDINTQVELEHEIILERGKNNYTPDALIYFENKGDSFKMAFDLELTRKSTDKYLEKIGHYLKSRYYDYALYFFNSKGVMDSYKKHVLSTHGSEAFNKLLLALNINLNKKNPNFEESIVFFMGKEVQLKDIFNK